MNILFVFSKTNKKRKGFFYAQYQGNKNRSKFDCCVQRRNTGKHKVLFATKARNDGYNEIANIFEQTAKNELAHARLWYKYLHSDEMPDTQTNLTEAVDGENFEWEKMNPEFSKTAAEEGFTEIARLFDLVAKVESQHESKFRQLLTNVKNQKVFTKDGEAIWICMNCGHIVVGKSAPEVCPLCKVPKAYFKEYKNS